MRSGASEGCVLGTGIVANFSFIESYFQSFFLFRLGYDSRLNFLNREMLLKLPLLGSVIFVAHHLTIGKLIFMQPRDLHRVMVIIYDLSQSGDMVRLRLIKFKHVLLKLCRLDNLNILLFKFEKNIFSLASFLRVRECEISIYGYFKVPTL